MTERKPRLDALRREMAAQGLAAALLLKPASQHYLTLFKAIIYSRPIMTLITPDKTSIIVPGLEETHAQEEAGVEEIHVYYEHPEKAGQAGTALEVLSRLVEELGPSPRIGLEYGFTPLGLVRTLEGWGAGTFDLDPVLTRMRLIKDQEELDLLRAAGKLVSLAVQETLSRLRPGMSELEAEALGDRAALARAAEDHPGAVVETMAMTTSGRLRTVLPHVLSSSRAFEAKEIIIHSRQLGLTGYRAECERTVFIGRPDPRQEKVFQMMFQAQQAAIAAVGPGNTCRAVDEAARSVFQKAGLGEYAIHRTGHGLGLEPHEAPYLRFDEEALLEPGMVVSIEPGVYVPEVGGYRHSDTVIVTDDGGELITEAPAELKEVIF